MISRYLALSPEARDQFIPLALTDDSVMLRVACALCHPRSGYLAAVRMVGGACENCGRAFAFDEYRGKRRFCSRRCANTNRRVTRGSRAFAATCTNK